MYHAHRYHETFNLPEPPHIVTYGKKMLSGGLYAREGILPNKVKREQLVAQFCYQSLCLFNRCLKYRTHLWAILQE